MGDIKHIIISLMGSIILLGGIGVWIAHRNGGEAPLLSQSNSDAFNQETPGPVQATPTNTTKDTMNPTPGAKNPTATFHTNKGDITLELYQDAMPITVGNFVKLAKAGFYNGTKFHRVIPGFMIQGGDPNTKTENTATYGTGGPGYTIQDEFVTDPRLTNVRGTIAMANTGQPNSGGSQFFINLVDNTGLDFDKPPATSSHPVFGHVISGLNIVDVIGAVKTGDRDMPVDPVVINSIDISE